MATVRVRVTSGSRIEGLRLDGDLIHARVTSRPIDGWANRRLTELLAKRLTVPKSHVTVVRGHSSRMKTVQIEGLDRRDVMERLTT